MSSKAKHMLRSHKTWLKNIAFKSTDKAHHERFRGQPVYKNSANTCKKHYNKVPVAE